MAQPLCPALSGPWIFPEGWGAAQPPPPADRGRGCSPASSPNSWGSAPAGSPAPSTGRPGARTAPRGPRAGRRGGRLGGGQRQSASEREKLRMRTLARALHELRRFLPPSVAPAGQSLTKIETLRLAIRYIGHLSAVLGLSEDSLRRRRPRPRSGDAAPPRGCPLCPDGCPEQAQAQTPTPARGQILGSPVHVAGSWGPPPACLGVPAAPGCLGSRIPDVGPWVSPPYCSGTQSLPPVSQCRAPDAALWTPPEAGSGTQVPTEPGTPATPWAPPPAALEPAAVYQGICVSPEPYLWPETPPPLLPGPACRRLQPQAQWGYWGHGAEVPPGSEHQGPGPSFHFSDDSPLQTSGLQLGGCPGLWPEDLDGGQLSIFY